MTRQQHARLPIIRCIAAVLMAGLGVASAANPEQQPVVAQATLVIGVAHLAGSDGERRVVDRGASVRVGDRIETAAGGHVHLRFVDGARVSVRPSSRLAVEDYSRSVAGGSGAIKFRLEEGVVRSITGEWGEASRERFRLNTPLAAIGIKGTDFVARAAEDRTSASVFTGSIVFSPLDAQCASSVGPCLNGREALLTQEMRGQVLQVERERAQPLRVITEAAPSRGGRSLNAVVVSAALPTDKALAGAPDAEGVDKSVSNAVLASDSLSSAPTEPSTPTEPTEPAPPMPPITPEVPTTPTTPPPPVVLPPTVQQLAWGRWTWAQPIAGDTLAQTIDAAFRTGRQGLVSDGAHSLFRPSAPADARLVAQDTSASFRLAGGSAHVVSRDGGSTQPATVTGGILGVDFVDASFATQLDIVGASIGSHEVNASGSILPNGVFLSTRGNAYVAGGLSLDGLEAGYFFDKAIDAGQLRGLTLWGR